MAEALTADTSVVVAGLSAWLPAHVVAESVSVLTRLPSGQAVEMAEAVDILHRLVKGRVKQLSSSRYLSTFSLLGQRGLAGGAVYDAIVGATAKQYDTTLLSLDPKARRTYAALGVRYELLDSAT